MARIDDLRYYAARKAKADALPAAVRDQHRAVYGDILRRIRMLMVDELIDALQGLRLLPVPDAVYAANDD